MDEKLLKVLTFIAVVVTTGWFITFIILPAVRPDFVPRPEVTVTMTAIITAVAGLLGGAYLKSKRADDEPDDNKKHEDGNRGGGVGD